jgi:hypothetical protein
LQIKTFALRDGEIAPRKIAIHQIIMLQRDYGLSSILEPEPSNQPSISCPLEIDDSESISSRAHHLELIRDQFNEEGKLLVSESTLPNDISSPASI